MKLQLILALLLLSAMMGLIGCYTQLGYHASPDFDQRYRKVLEGVEMEHRAKSEEESESEKPGADEDSEDYYKPRKPIYRKRHVPSYRYDTYWVPYAPYYAYPPAFYYPYPWFYGDAYGYYGGYYSSYRYHRIYYPYINVYRRYHGGSRYIPFSRHSYRNRGNWRNEHRRSWSSRGVTSPRAKSERPQRPTGNRNE